MSVRRGCLALVATLLASTGLSVLPGIHPARALAASRVRFVAGPGSSILVHGTYPKVQSECKATTQPVLHARYAGTVEVGKDTDGSLFVIGELPFERYLEGIAEVPRTWPMEALKAQVVAARSYALSRVSRPEATGERLGYQLCATDACQVYRGLGISDGPYGELWREAVKATDGEVLLFNGRPADTLYSSTSPGYTLGNDEVFGSAPLPYLRPAKETDDAASPLSHWHVAMPFGDLARFLRAGGDWGKQAISKVRLERGNVVIQGGGAKQTMEVSGFRSALNYWAHCLDPDDYPSVDSDGRLPQTVPSIWFGLSTTHGTVELDGRGWGHGVGMVQWGAYGKARRGLSYRQILAAYYGGLRPTRYDAEPAVIRVGIATGVTSLTVEATGSVEVIGRDPGPGPWRVTGGKSLRVKPGPPAPVWVKGSSFARTPTAGRSGRPIHATVSVPELSVVQLQLRVEGTDVAVGPAQTVEPGIARLEGVLPEVPTGPHELRILTTNGIDRAFSAARTVQIRGVDPSPSPSPAASPPTSPSPQPVVAAPSPAGSVRPLVVGLSAVGAAILVALVVLLLAHRRAGRRHGEPGTG